MYYQSTDSTEKKKKKQQAGLLFNDWFYCRKY